MTNEKNSGAEPIVLGALHGAYGLKGWVRVQPFQGTSALLGSKHWQHVLPDGEVRPVELEKAKLHGAGTKNSLLLPDLFALPSYLSE